MKDITGDMTLNEIVELAKSLAESTFQTIEIVGAIADATEAGAFVVLRGGGVDDFDFTPYVRDEGTEGNFPLTEDDVEAFRLAEALLLSELAIIRRGFASVGIDVPLAPTVLRSAAAGL